MSTIGWIIVIAAIAVVVIVATLVVSRISSSRRRTHLQEQFGPEYDRTVDETGSRRAAEQELEEREKQHAELDLRPLSSAARSRFTDEWSGVQQRFLDDPEGAASQAERLVRRVMDERGYPPDDETVDRAAIVSVDHPDVVERYRHGRETLDARASGREERTENLRVAMVDFRTVLESLLETDDELVAGGAGGRTA
jgi:hypothetical protein